MKKNGNQPKILAFLLIAIMLILWVVVCKPFSDVPEYNEEEIMWDSEQAIVVEPQYIETVQPDVQSTDTEQPAVSSYRFRNKKLLDQHYEKHGREMGFASAADYEAAAAAVIANPNALTKTEAEDGDFVYYVESTNEFVILSTDGYIRTYFNPSSGIKYYNRQ